MHDNPQALIEDAQVEILDIAFPPDQQPDLIRQALKQPHIKAILAQKPLAMNFETARAFVAEAKAAGKMLSVNQNMRYDQSIRVLKQLLERGDLGEPVLATIEMRAIPHWQPFLKDYGRLTLLNMSIHHLDALRYLFGDPETITTIARADPRTSFAHTDGITHFEPALSRRADRAVDGGCLGGPRQRGRRRRCLHQMAGRGNRRRRQRHDRLAGLSRRQPVDIALCRRDRRAANGSRQAGRRNGSRDAFAGVMEQLQYALDRNEAPALTGADNVKTMALIEAGYRSIAENRPVALSEFAI